MRLIHSCTGATAHVVVVETSRPDWRTTSGTYSVRATWKDAPICVELAVEHQVNALKLARALAHATTPVAIAEALALAMTIGSGGSDERRICADEFRDRVQTRGFGHEVGSRPRGPGASRSDGSQRNSCEGHELSCAPR